MRSTSMPNLRRRNRILPPAVLNRKFLTSLSVMTVMPAHEAAVDVVKRYECRTAHRCFCPTQSPETISSRECSHGVLEQAMTVTELHQSLSPFSHWSGMASQPIACKVASWRSSLRRPWPDAAVTPRYSFVQSLPV